jgi:hypothetical protein
LENSIPQKNIKIELPCDLAIPLLGIYLKELKSVGPQDFCTPTFIEVLVPITKKEK